MSKIYAVYRVESKVIPEVWDAYKNDAEYDRRIMEIGEFADSNGTSDYAEPYHWAEVENDRALAERIGYEYEELNKEYLQKLNTGE